MHACPPAFLFFFSASRTEAVVNGHIYMLLALPPGGAVNEEFERGKCFYDVFKTAPISALGQKEAGSQARRPPQKI